MSNDITFQAIQMLINYHIFFLFIVPIVFIINLFNLYVQKNYAVLNKRLWFCMPLLFSLYAVNFLLGITIWAMEGFGFSFGILWMIVIWLLALIWEVKRNKKLKTSRLSEESMQQYVKLCKQCYFGLLIIYVASMVVLGI